MFKSLLRKPLFLLSLLSLSFVTWGQEPAKHPVYKINYAVEIPLTMGGYVLNYYGQQALLRKPRLTEAELATLSPDDLPWIERGAAKQDPAHTENALFLSDVGLNIGAAMPALLFLDKEIRKDWFKILVLYFEAQSFNTDLHIASILLTNRKRPFNYNPRESLERKTGTRTTDSFFSGHVSVTTGGTFFAAQVLLDYHPHLASKKWLIYGAATVPAAFVGFYRYRSGKHFPSDMIVGYLVGAGTSILTPYLHRIKSKKNIAFAPLVHPQAKGLSMVMRFH